MAPTCSHILTNATAPSGSRVPSHSRNVSTISSTVHTSTTVHSQPTEPLLRPTTPKTEQYLGGPSHRPINSEISLGLPRWSQSHVMGSHAAPIVSDKGSKSPRKRVKLLRWIRNGLAIVMALWAVYNTVRYFVAFFIYGSITGQALSITMGAITGLSFAFICCATILKFVQPRLLIHGFPVQSLLTLRSSLEYLASCCLLGPSIANFVLILVWKKTTDMEFQTRNRCRIDVDLVWSPPFSLCSRKTSTWALWLALSAIRLVVTLIIIITFHFITLSTQRKLIRRSQSPHQKGHNRLDSHLTTLIPRNHYSKSSVVIPHLGPDSNHPSHSSDSTFSTQVSPRNRLRPNRSRLSAFSENDVQSEPPNYNNADFLPMNSDHVDSDSESNSFVNRFRTLISQITRETEEGMAFACSDDSGSSDRAKDEFPELDSEGAHRSDLEDYDNEDGFYTSSGTLTESYEQYQQYPADEEIRMLNGFITRMPTIESMGSHEVRSSLGASSANRDRERIGRPPTRNTLGSWVGTEFSGTNETQSGANSLTAQAEVLAGMHHTTEIGELIKRGGDTVRKIDSQSTNVDNLRSLGASTNSTYSSGVLSYLTASDISKSLVNPETSSFHVPSPEHPESSRRQDNVVDEEQDKK